MDKHKYAISPAGFRDGDGGGVCLSDGEAPNAVEVAHGHQGPVLYLHPAFDGLGDKVQRPFSARPLC